MKKLFTNFKNKIMNTKTFFLNIAIFICFMIFIIAAGFVISLNTNLIKTITDNTSYQLILEYIILYFVGLGLPLLIYKLIFKFKFDFKFKFKKLYLKNLLISVALGFLIQPIGMALSGISSFIVNENVASSLVQSIDTNCNFYLVAFSLAILPGIFEELVFRNLFYKNLKAKYKVLTSAIISGILFGLFHMNFQQFVYAVVLGFIFAYIFEKTNNILDTMIIHFTINFTQMLASFLMIKNLGSEIYESSSAISTYTTFESITVIICLIVFGGVFIPIVKKLITKYTSINNNLSNESKLEVNEIKFESNNENENENEIKSNNLDND